MTAQEVTRRARPRVGRGTGSSAAGLILALALTVGGGERAQASSVGRLYVKYQGKTLAAWSLDANGNLLMTGVPQWWAIQNGLSMTGFLFKNAGTALYAIKPPSATDPRQYGQFLIGYNNIGDQIPQLPTGTGSLVLKSNGVARLEFATQAAGGYVAISQLYYDSFGVRKNASTLTPLERKNYQDALVALRTTLHHPGTDGACGTTATGFQVDGSPMTYRLPGGVSYFSKFDEMHAEGYDHGDNFLAWHRQMLQRFEDALRAYDPSISVPYWDWNTNPVDILTPGFLGVYQGYDPNNPGVVDPCCVPACSNDYPCLPGETVPPLPEACNGQIRCPNDDPGIGNPFRDAGFYDPGCNDSCYSSMGPWSSATDPCSNTSCGATNGAPGGACRQPSKLEQMGGSDCPACIAANGIAACKAVCMQVVINPGFNSSLNPRYIIRATGTGFDPSMPGGLATVDDYGMIHGSDAVDPTSAFDFFMSGGNGTLGLSFYHAEAHDFFGPRGLTNLDVAAADPFFFVMHSNIDRLWASWQAMPGPDYAYRRDPNHNYSGPDTITAGQGTSGPNTGVYGSRFSTIRMQDLDPNLPSPGRMMPMEVITSALEPWSDVSPTGNTWWGYRHVRPWTNQCIPAANCSGEAAEAPKTSTAADIVTPPLYDAYVSTCASPFATELCPNYFVGCLVTDPATGHNFRCKNSNCTLCGDGSTCGPGQPCSAGTGWTDEGACM